MTSIQALLNIDRRCEFFIQTFDRCGMPDNLLCFRYRSSAKLQHRATQDRVRGNFYVSGIYDGGG